MLSDKWEKTVQALRTEVSDKEGRINELSSLLREARDKTIEVCWLVLLSSSFIPTSIWFPL